MKRVSTLWFLGFVVTLALSGCGPSGPTKSIRVTITDFSFSPNSFTVPAGEPIAFAASNNGAVQHDFIIMKLGSEVHDKFSDADKSNIYWQREFIDPGKSVTDTFTAPSTPGEYQIVCGIAGHFQAGMIGKLVVVAATP